MTARYEWPSVTAIHPDRGAYLMDVHCLRTPDGTLVLMAFHGQPQRDRTKQVALVRQTARDLGYKVEPLAEADVSQEVATTLAAHFAANPGTGIGVLQVRRPNGAVTS